jgi:hypothetical protein
MAYYSSVGQRTRTYPPNDQVQLRVDPIHGDLDEEVHGLHGKVVQLKQLAQHIESETKFQNELLNQLVSSFTCALHKGHQRACQEALKSVCICTSEGEGLIFCEQFS